MPRFYSTAFCLLILTFKLTVNAAPASAVATFRQFTGTIGSRTPIHMALTITGTKATGSFYSLTTAPSVMTVYTVDGTFTDRKVELAVSDPDLPDPIARIAARYATQKTTRRAIVLGTWTPSKAGDKVEEVQLNEDELTWTVPPRISDTTLTLNSKKPRYDTTIVTPHFIDRAPGEFDWINSRLKSVAAAQARDWVKLARDIDMGDDSPTSEPNWLDCEYEIMEFTSSFLSVRFKEETFTGGAHPNSSFATYNFDLKAHRELRLPDLFPPNTPYLRPIALSAIAALSADHDADYSMITAGASTHESNYQNWNLTRWGLIISFDPYQVASYAVGPQEVYYPRAVLSALRPDVAELLPASHPK